ncbi:MAG: YifB family Mg chelatase-like AAA ATPase [Candidatus Omnitrophica bacterium]|nr:YifB family Mg chelatase-like AAA ATPase [Candidatus Omnitrophota bacterium]
MLAKIESRAIYGISAYRIDVEVDITRGIPNFSIVGLPDTGCRESSKRVITALRNSGYDLPSMRITVNLAPAYVRKEGSIYDVAIALGILTAMKKIDCDSVKDKVVCGELSLDGTMQPVRGALCIADGLRGQKDKEMIVPFDNLIEVSAIKGVRISGARTLNELAAYLVEGRSLPDAGSLKENTRRCAEKSLDFSEIKGNGCAKRAIEVAAAGAHNIILIGPPGVGKTMLGKRLPTILDELSMDESIETSKIYSVAGMLGKRRLIRRPPFRILHQTISGAGAVGGGSIIRPGEISLSHNGVMFLDETAEFRRDVLESLRQPLEEGLIRLRRANMSVTYPAEFMLVAAMNPCPCGFLTHPEKTCSCTPPQVQKYLSKISGPLLDRIDMHIEVQPVRYEQMREKRAGEASQVIRERVKKARALQARRYSRHKFRFNAKLPHRFINEVCSITDEAADLLKKAMVELFISARAYDKILRVARTIADLDGRLIIGVDEISEAVGYRSLDTKSWLM